MKDPQGIVWMPGDEDYPFPSRRGEDPTKYCQRWLDEAPYARIERDGVRYVHETDVANLVTALTVDLDLLDGSLSVWGERLLRADERAALEESLRKILNLTAQVLAVIERDRPAAAPVWSTNGDQHLSTSEKEPG